MAAGLQYTEAEYGVPHTKFERTPSGFTVRYQRMSFWTIAIFFVSTIPFLLMILWGLFVTFVAPQGIDDSAKAIALGVPVTTWFLLYKFTRPKTEIQVDADSVRINKTMMRRGDFGSFNIWGQADIAAPGTATKTAFVRLGYQLGSRQFPLPGLWSEREAREVASGLNTQLRKAPLGADVATPEVLRTSRPTDF